jgi:hypothetical protein
LDQLEESQIFFKQNCQFQCLQTHCDSDAATKTRTSEHTFLGHPTKSLQQDSTSSYGSQHDPTVLTTMGFLSLCADSAHPPGSTTNQACTNGLFITPGNESDEYEHSNSAAMPCTVVDTFTSYYQTHPFISTPGLHVISALTHPFNNPTATRQLTE